MVPFTDSHFSSAEVFIPCHLSFADVRIFSILFEKSWAIVEILSPTPSFISPALFLRFSQPSFALSIDVCTLSPIPVKNPPIASITGPIVSFTAAVILSQFFIINITAAIAAAIPAMVSTTGAAAVNAPPIAGTIVPVIVPPRLLKLDKSPRPFIAEINGAIFARATSNPPIAIITFCTGAGRSANFSIVFATPSATGSNFKTISAAFSPTPENESCTFLQAACIFCDEVVVLSFNSLAFPATSLNASPTGVSDSMNFVFPSSPIVPNAVAAKFILSCSFVVFLISSTMEFITSFCEAPPSFHLLKSSSVFWDQMPVPSLTCPVFSSICVMVSAIVPSARRVVTSLIASLTLSRLYAPPSDPFFSN